MKLTTVVAVDLKSREAMVVATEGDAVDGGGAFTGNVVSRFSSSSFSIYPILVCR